MQNPNQPPGGNGGWGPPPGYQPQGGPPPGAQTGPPGAPPQQSYGQPQQGYGQPQPGYQPQGAYSPAPGQPQYGAAGQPKTADPRYKKLEDNALVWLLVTCGSWFLSIGFIVGPIGWYFTSKLKKQYRELGHEPSGMCTAAYICSIITTVFWLLGVLAIVAMFVFFGGLFFAAAAGA